MLCTVTLVEQHQRADLSAYYKSWKGRGKQTTTKKKKKTDKDKHERRGETQRVKKKKKKVATVTHTHCLKGKGAATALGRNCWSRAIGHRSTERKMSDTQHCEKGRNRRCKNLLTSRPSQRCSSPHVNCARATVPCFVLHYINLSS